jgi:uncharacterized protein YbaP (TraB family)
MWKALGVVAALAMAPGLAAAQARLEDPEANIVEELVVQAKTPGPAWWKVSDGDTTVWILGVADESLPGGVTWDRRWTDRRLKGANSLIVGTRVSLKAKITDVPALLKIRGQLKSKAPMETTLPDGLRTRFVAARTRIGQPEKKYAGWQPLMAGQMLLADAKKAGGTAPVVDPILKAAKRGKVKLVDPARYDAMPFLRAAMGSLTPELQTRCLTWALDDAEAPAGRVRAAAEGWARGDVAAALREPRSFEKCLLLLGGGAELWKRVVADDATAIQAALATPGHSVAIVSLRLLLAEGGVAQTLEARGVEVEGGG